MKRNQLTRGQQTRIMYVENKDGDIDGVPARIGWVTFSRSGRSVYYRERTLRRAKGGGIRGNFYDVATQAEYWISGVKKVGSNQLWWDKSIHMQVDGDAIEEYKRIKSGPAG